MTGRTPPTGPRSAGEAAGGGPVRAPAAAAGRRAAPRLLRRPSAWAAFVPAPCAALGPWSEVGKRKYSPVVQRVGLWSGGLHPGQGSRRPRPGSTGAPRCHVPMGEEPAPVGGHTRQLTAYCEVLTRRGRPSRFLKPLPPGSAWLMGRAVHASRACAAALPHLCNCLRPPPCPPPPCALLTPAWALLAPPPVRLPLPWGGGGRRQPWAHVRSDWPR